MLTSSSQRFPVLLVASFVVPLACLANAGCGGSAGGAGTTGAGGTTGTAGAAGTSAAAGAAGVGAAGMGAAGVGAAGVGAAGASWSAGAKEDAGAGGAAGQGGAAGIPSVDAGGDAGAAGHAPFVLTSSAFVEGAEIPLLYKCANVPPAGMNQTPPLSWTPGPAGTQSYAVTLNHVASGSAHWAIWDIPVGTTSLAANIDHVALPPIPQGSTQPLQSLDGFVGIGYQGPCPQSVNARQMYRFTVWALPVAKLSLPSRSSTAFAQTTIKAAAGATATLTGTQIQTP